MNKKTFKDFVIEDLNVFINLDEFADIHIINGTEKTCIIIDNELETRSNNKTETYDGVYGHEIVLYIKASDFGEKPVFGERIEIDDDFYYVQSCQVSDGLYAITLRANES